MNYLEQHMDESIAELSRLCAQPSVAAQNWGLAECAALVAEMLQKRGFTVEILPYRLERLSFLVSSRDAHIKPCCSITTMMSNHPNRWNYGKHHLLSPP